MSWIATTYLGAAQKHNAKVIAWSEPLYRAFLAGAWILHWTEDTLYWVAKPEVHVEKVEGGRGRRLHCENGPTLRSDVENLYFWHGVLVPAFVVTKPEWITVQHIRSEQNAEVRRVMIERYGLSRYLLDSEAKLISEDEMGKLHRTEIEGDEPLVMVELLNSTPEPTGEYKTYFLRVPPNMATAREAVAWTFNMTADEYVESLVAQT